MKKKKQVVKSTTNNEIIKKGLPILIVILLLLILIFVKACTRSNDLDDKKDTKPNKDKDITDVIDKEEKDSEEGFTTENTTPVVKVCKKETKKEEPTKVVVEETKPEETEKLATTIITGFPANLEYDGEAKVVTVRIVGEDGTEITDGYTVKYVDEANNEVSQLKEVGTYTITVTYEGNETYKANTYTTTLTITPIRVSSNTTLADALRLAKEGDEIIVDSTITEDTTLDKSVTLKGENGVLSAKLTVTAPNVVIDGLTLKDTQTGVQSGKGNGIALVKVTSTGDFTFTNNVISAPAGKAYNGLSINTTGKVTIDNNTFNNSNGNIYNAIEFSNNTPLANGSSISNNYFKVGANTHNMINIYNIEDNATIDLNNNTFEFSGNAYRFANTKNHTATINMNNNKYDTTDDYNNYEYAGLICFQPWPGENPSYANYTINMNNLVGPNGTVLTANGTGINQIYYTYDDANRTVELPTIHY